MIKKKNTLKTRRTKQQRQLKIVISLLATSLALQPIPTYATGVFDFGKYPFKQNAVEDANYYQYTGISSNIPSLTDYANKINIRSNPMLPDVSSYATSTSFDNVTVSKENGNSKLKSSDIKYDSNGWTTDKVFTGYWFSSGFIFPIDLRENRQGSADGLIFNSPMGFRGGVYHNGIDIAGGIGENGNKQEHNYYIPIDSTIICKVNSASYGTMIGIEFSLGDKYTYRMYFCHLKENSVPSYIKEGVSVEQGTYFGQMGRTGNSTGNHLHWEAMRFLTGYSIPSSLSLINSTGTTTPYKYNKSSSTVQCILHSNYIGAEAITFDPTKLYGNNNSGQALIDWYAKIGIKSNPVLNDSVNTKLPFIQLATGESKTNVPFPKPQDYEIN